MDRTKISRAIHGWVRSPAYKILHLLRYRYFVRRLYLLVERKYLKSNVLMTAPTLVKVNTGYVCNLRCPHCPTGQQNPGNSQTGPIPKKDLTLDDTRFILSRLGPVHTVTLFGWGEPFLNKEIFPIIRYLKEMRRYVSLDSNLNIKKESIVRGIEECRVDLLSVSIDGADEDSYKQYRYRGSFELALRNLTRIHKALKGPRRVEWQYIVNRKNSHHFEAAREMARSRGIPFRSFDIGLYQDLWYRFEEPIKQEWLTEAQLAAFDDKNLRARSNTCHYMYNEPYVDPDGRVYPCCNAPHVPKAVLDEGYENVFGDLHENTLEAIWNNEYYQYMRAQFSGRAYDGPPVKPVCLRCKVYLRAAGKSEEILPRYTAPLVEKAAQPEKPVAAK